MDKDDLNIALTWATVTLITWLLLLLIFPKSWIGVIIAFAITIAYTNIAAKAYINKN